MDLVLKRFSICFAVVFAWIVPAAAAPSALDVKKAAEAFDRGREAYRAESYIEAAEHFEAADDSAPSSAAIRLAMAARQAAGQLDRALTLAALALETYPSDADVQAEAQAVIDEHQEKFARVQVSCDESCELTMDNKLVHGPGGMRHIVYVEPGSHEVQATFSEERSDGRRFAALAGETREVELFAPEPIVEPVPANTDWYEEEEPKEEEAPPEPKGWSPAVFWTGFGLTATGLAVTTGLGINALNNPGPEAVTDSCPANNFEDCNLYQQGLANQTAANVAGGVTAAIGVFTIVTGIWLTNWSGKKKPKEPPADVWSFNAGRFKIRPNVSVGDGATLGAVGSF